MVERRENRYPVVDVWELELRSERLEVRQVPEKMDAKEEGYRCWSKMQRLAICSDHPFGRSAEAEFENL